LKKRIKYTLLIFIVLVLAIQYGFSQEQLTGLDINPVIKKLGEKQNHTKKEKIKATVELPFIDDFSSSVGYPDNSLWIDNYAFANLTYPLNPKSIGVITLDAIDGNGSIYQNASTNSFGADTLTSQQINLNYPGDNTIYLSFLYQPGGLGDTPEPKDSLILEYYSPDSAHWNKIWHVSFNEQDSLLKEYFYLNATEKLVEGDTLFDLRKNFHSVLVPVNKDEYLKSDFQFRFRNRASLSGGDDLESKAGNSDHWHIDYVILNNGRNSNDTVINDIAMQYPIGSLFNNYESVPWTHVTRATAYEMIDTISITYINNNNTERGYSQDFAITDIMGLSGTYSFTGGGGNPIPAFSTKTYSRPLDYIYLYNPTSDSALFEVSAYLTTDNPSERIAYRWNDTTRYFQKFYNYYAYDDGTAENGYGIVGEGTDNAMVAMRFSSYKKDTLRGVQMYFNQVLKDANQYNFKIHVWAASGNEPGSILYTYYGAKPQNQDELNKFTSFIFDETLVLEGDFFIGWQKINTTEMLNVGFDLNRINNDKLYYNFSGTWVQSLFEGTVMIRPMFGHEIITGMPTEPVPGKNIDFTIYPNPANDVLNINTPENMGNYRITIFDGLGRIFYDEPKSETSIPISNLKSGIYFIRLSNNSGISTTRKFIVNHN